MTSHVRDPRQHHIIFSVLLLSLLTILFVTPSRILSFLTTSISILLIILIPVLLLYLLETYALLYVQFICGFTCLSLTSVSNTQVTTYLSKKENDTNLVTNVLWYNVSTKQKKSIDKKRSVQQRINQNVSINNVFVKMNWSHCTLNQTCASNHKHIFLH